MKVYAAKCPRCGDLVFSRARHDMRSCSCEGISIDGGFDYCKMSAKPELANKIEFVDVEIKATRKELYDDWANSIDKFGLISKSKVERFGEGEYKK